jgi:high-affinity nickel-transport protein
VTSLNISALSAAALGFLLGLKHATDADHVVAITTIVSREKSFRRAAWIGGLWGVGHSLTVFLVGGALVLFRITMPPRVGLSLEFGVAIMLIVLGFNNLRPSQAAKTHSHDIPPQFNSIRPVIIGVVHGLAGSAAAALLVLAAISNTVYALAYLFIFGVGTIGGMTLITAMLAVPSVYAADRVVRLQSGIRIAAGALSLVFGLIVAREIIVGGGLFSASPSWTPK